MLEEQASTNRAIAKAFLQLGFARSVGARSTSARFLHRPTASVASLCSAAKNMIYLYLYI
jgi:hypothetical protein